MPNPNEKRVDLILQQLEELPTLPAVVARVVEVTANDLSSAKQVVKLISSDPALTARILQLIHRADKGVAGDVHSLERAVVLLGFDAIRSAVLAISVFQCFGARDPAAPSGHFSRDEFWKHCVAVACCAELLAESAMTTSVSASDAFICGLLHDMGKVALDATLPKSFSRVVEAADLLRGNIADIERSVIGIDHMVVGKRLAEKWKLPAVIRDCIWLHGQDPRALPATVKVPRMVNIVTLADQIVREQHLGYSGNYLFPLSREALLDGAGLTPAMVESAVSKLVGRIEPRAESLGLGRTTTTELFQQALAQANKELGRVSGQLAQKNRKLTVRAQFFEAMSKFQGQLQPDAAPKAVLQAIAQAAVSVLRIPCSAAFSLPPGQSYAETLLCDDQGHIFQTSLIDLPPLDTGDKKADPSAPAPKPDANEAAKVAMTPSAGNGTACTARRASIEDAALAAKAGPGEASTSAGRALYRPPAARAGEGPVLTAGPEMEWLVDIVSPRLPNEKRFWICLEADGHCIGGVVWGAEPGEAERLSSQVQELATIAAGWALALRTAQIREEARALAEQLAEANRQLQNAQVEILRSRTLITVGEMAAGAAHEMNNPLAIISGRSQLLAQQLTEPKYKAAATLVHEQADRLSGIISELMDFARPEPAVIKPVKLSELIDYALREAKINNDPADRKIAVAISDVQVVLIDLKQVSAAVAEVMENAIQATQPSGGSIQIQAGYDPYSSRVALTVTDNGCGMDENTVARAFDPFFSAKPAGRRRGLGLPKALRWIEASHGSIRLESRPAIGTRAVILLRAAAAAMAGAPGPIPAAGSAELKAS